MTDKHLIPLMQITLLVQVFAAILSLLGVKPAIYVFGIAMLLQFVAIFTYNGKSGEEYDSNKSE